MAQAHPALPAHPCWERWGALWEGELSTAGTQCFPEHVREGLRHCPTQSPQWKAHTLSTRTRPSLHTLLPRSPGPPLLQGWRLGRPVDRRCTGSLPVTMGPQCQAVRAGRAGRALQGTHHTPGGAASCEACTLRQGPHCSCAPASRCWHSPPRRAPAGRGAQLGLPYLLRVHPNERLHPKPHLRAGILSHHTAPPGRHVGDKEVEAPPSRRRLSSTGPQANRHMQGAWRVTLDRTAPGALTWRRLRISGSSSALSRMA